MELDLAHAATERFVVPSYEGPSLVGLVPGLFGLLGIAGEQGAPRWLEEHLGRPERVVLLVLDGLGYLQLQDRARDLGTLGSLRVIPACSTAPTTTATALTSLTTGAVPARHGVLGYRMALGGSTVLNVLRWSVNGQASPPLAERVAPIAPFLGANPVAVTKATYAETAFTKVHLRGARLRWWSTMSQVVSRILEALALGERFVYAYYEGVDTTAHEFGLGAAYERELRLVDTMVGMLLERLPRGVALVVTADHGEVEVGGGAIRLDDALRRRCHLVSGEGRFRWLHARERPEELAALCRARFGEIAEVLTRREAIERGLFGGAVPPTFEGRLGDVALVATEPVWFEDPDDQGTLRMRARHGGLSGAELLVPVAVAP